MTATETRRVEGVTRGGLPWWFLQSGPSGRSLILLNEEDDVMDLVDDMAALRKMPADLSAGADVEIIGYPADDEPARQVALHAWAFGRSAVLIASKEGLVLPADSPEDLRRRSARIRPGSHLPRRAFEEALLAGGYSRNERAEQVGEVAIRGDVADVWAPSMEAPVRITWNFDTVEALRVIDVHSQRSEGFLTELTLHPITAGTASTLRDYLTPETSVILFGIEGPADFGGAPVVSVSANAMGPAGQDFAPPPLFAGAVDRLREQLERWHQDDWRAVVFCHNRGERDRLEELLKDRMSSAMGIRPPWMPAMIIGELEHGFVQPLRRLAVLANSEIFGRYRKRIRLPKFEGGGALSSAMDIRPNDFLVHEKHGIGRYLGLKSLKVGSVTSEYLSLEYKGGDKLYVPIFEIQQVQKYLGAEGRRPALSSLDTAAWERIKSKVQEDVAKLAADLLRKAAKRSVRPGYAFPPRTRMEDEFAASFMYPLTPDQAKTLEEVERDMMAPRAMDRLICGDVGYGKTEIAMRAALKAALAGKQVALLCPTTILAEQHARNFTERMADYPVKVQLLSRFQEKADQKAIIASVLEGKVDIIIGTHRLLSSDIRFQDLGLLIIDEEHRFGVRQKNKLLSLRETVDVLSLTATPIPRTLASSLGGIKDLSVIETAPEGRLPISTHVGLFDEDLMVKAVQTELDRGGQVFYVHNRVKTLEARRDWLKGILPNIRIAMAHGQMNEEQLEDGMHGFLHRKVDVLLATTIIESGLDIPSVNTLIVEEAEELGLSQLYQLRGRVGRSRMRAYCYLFYSTAGLTTDAKKRLDALKEFTSLGSGLRLAMRDMEIRGAGNLLGPQQHGNMAAVGVETYSRLLNEEIHKLQGAQAEEKLAGPKLEFSISAYLPDDYLPSEAERVHMYKRILSAEADALARIREELVDRCGPLPAPAKMLFDAAALRLIARNHGVTEVQEEADGILIYFRSGYKFPEQAFNRLVAQPQDVLNLIAGPPTGVRVPMKEDENPLDVFGRFIRLVFPS